MPGYCGRVNTASMVNGMPAGEPCSARMLPVRRALPCASTWDDLRLADPAVDDRAGRGDHARERHRPGAEIELETELRILPAAQLVPFEPGVEVAVGDGFDDCHLSIHAHRTNGQRAGPGEERDLEAGDAADAARAHGGRAGQLDVEALCGPQADGAIRCADGDGPSQLEELRDRACGRGRNRSDDVHLCRGCTG